jgi:cytochrome c-type biogenesis protein CcmH
MTLWLILGAMGVAVAAVLFVGLRRGRPRPQDAAEHDIAVYRAQLDELDRDRERGVLEERELAAARLEVQRRLLAADAARRPGGEAAPKTPGWGLPLALALAVPIGAGALYLWLGQPGVDSEPFAERQRKPEVEGGEALPDVATMMARLRDRLAQQPDDLEGWIMLGRSAAALGGYDEAISAYRRALALDGERGEVYSALGEAQVLAAGGIVTEPAQAALEQAIARDPTDPRARFYLAIAREQDGDKQGALEALTALVADAPAGASWADGVRRRAAAIAEDLGLDPASILPPADSAATGSPTAGPGADDLAAVAEMSPAEQQVMVRGMVAKLAARLEAKPDDAQGWRMLGRSYNVLGEPEKAAEAFGRAAALLPDDPGAQLDYAAAQLTAAASGAPPPEAVARLEKIVAQDSANRDALYYLGEARRRQGDVAGAAVLWRRLLTQLPKESEDHAWLKTQLDALEAKD